MGNSRGISFNTGNEYYSLQFPKSWIKRSELLKETRSFKVLTLIQLTFYEFSLLSEAKRMILLERTNPY